MNDWKKPAFTEICMNAEIGAYQPDTDDPRDVPPVAVPSESALGSISAIAVDDAE
jgi:coenzyme PQQ precursor peptide PqqA